mmetsp:Transcript_10560/g.23262  ORF Transcript_10560/g.23262 Transcript_10560/m.23262 type:complete len:208 (+) Transcript_10560:367-990(+)
MGVVHLDINGSDVILKGPRAEGSDEYLVEAKLDAIAYEMDHHRSDSWILEVHCRSVGLGCAIAVITLVEPGPLVHIPNEWVQDVVVEAINVAYPSARQGVEPTNPTHGAPRVADVAKCGVFGTIVPLGYKRCTSPLLSTLPRIDAFEDFLNSVLAAHTMSHCDEVRVVVHEVTVREIGVHLCDIMIILLGAPKMLVYSLSDILGQLF